MGLANFFDRTEQAISQVLETMDPIDLKEHLDKTLVAVVFDDSVIDYTNGQIILEMVVNLLSRLYPTICIHYKGSKEDKIRKQMEDLSKSINPEIEFLDSSIKFKAVLSIGNKSLDNENIIYVAADSWNLELSYQTPTELAIGDQINPFSAGAVACFAVGEIFKIAFQNKIIPTPEPQSFKLSLFNYRKAFEEASDLPSLLDIKDLLLVGLGAVGNAAVWSLKRLPHLNGLVTLIDHEDVERSNLQRYVLTNQNHINKSKVNIAENELIQNELKIEKYALRFGEYVAKYRRNCNFDTIAVSVDNSNDRIAVQGVLPRIIFNAWTGDNGDLGVSQHIFDDPTKACLACIYINTTKKHSDTEELAKLTGLDLSITTEMVVKGVGLSKEILEDISRNKNYPMDVLMHFEGKTLYDFRREAICGGLLLTNETQNKYDLVPLAHQSALTGILLACEIVKHQMRESSYDYPVEIRFNILTKLPDYICLNRAKTLKCICTDQDYVNVYKKKYCTELPREIH